MTQRRNNKGAFERTVPMVVVKMASVPDIYFKVEATGFPDRLNVGGDGGEERENQGCRQV